MALSLLESREKATKLLAQYKQGNLENTDELANALEELLQATYRMNDEDVADIMSSHVNSISLNNNFIKIMLQKHRTLQQSFTRLCVQWLEELAKKTDAECDLRNQAAVCLARTFVEKIPPEKRMLPYI